MKEEKAYPVPRFCADAIIVEVYASHPASRKMLKIKELDVTGNIGQKAHGSRDIIRDGGNLFTIIDEMRALSPECEIKISVKII